MSKYVRWRTGDTKLRSGEELRFAPDAILAAIGETASLNSEGRVQYKGMMIHAYEQAVSESVAVRDPEGGIVNEVDTDGIVTLAIRDLYKDGYVGKPMPALAFLRAADRRAKEYFRLPKVAKVIATSMSVKEFPDFDQQVFGVRIRTTNDGELFDYPKGLEETSSYLANHAATTRYRGFVVHVDERTSHAAQARAEEALHAFRGLLTWVSTNGVRWFSARAFPDREWLGSIHGSPIRTCHTEGSASCEGYYYTPEYVADAQLYEPSCGWASVVEKFGRALERVSELPFAGEFRRVLARYGHAMEQSNLNVTFLELWSLLEQITDTVGGPYQKTIVRASYWLKDRKLWIQLLQTMQARRNLYVHSAQSLPGELENCRSLKQVIDVHVSVLLARQFGPASMRDYGEVLSLPQNLGRLERLRDRYIAAVEMVKKMRDVQQSN